MQLETTQEGSFRKMRNFQANQQSVLLALTNKYFIVSLNSPKKRSCVAQQMLSIKFLKEGNDMVWVEDFINRRIKEIEERDVKNGIPMKTATRRCESNKIAECTHLLMDILREFGYSFTTKLTNGKNGTVKSETIYSILLNGKIVVTKDQINTIGKDLNIALNNLLVQNQNVTLVKEDPVFQQPFNLIK